jgi:hypothetical protein
MLGSVTNGVFVVPHKWRHGPLRGRAHRLFRYSYMTIIQRVELFGRVPGFLLGLRILSLHGGTSYCFGMGLLIHSDWPYLFWILGHGDGNPSPEIERASYACKPALEGSSGWSGLLMGS